MLNVAVGIVFNRLGQLLIAKRPQHLSMGGHWELPGGKIESGETEFEALKRELSEEVGIEVTEAEILLEYQYHYPERSIDLHFWKVLEFQGEAHGREGQVVRWIEIDTLSEFKFLEANKPLLEYLEKNFKKTR